MTSRGSPIVQLQRELARRQSPALIRAAAAGLGHPPPLDIALDISLALLDLEPHTWPLLSARWGARLAIERKLTLVDAQLTLAALAALPGPAARAGAEALIEISARYRLDRIDTLLQAWLDRRGLTDPA